MKQTFGINRKLKRKIEGVIYIKIKNVIFYL